MDQIAIIGAGFVADFYMRSLEMHPNIKVAKVFDKRSDRLKEFCTFWNVPDAQSMDDILDENNDISLVLNLTNPGAHYEVSKACLEAGKHVYSEKPLAIEMDHAYELHQLSKDKGVMLGSAPCSFLCETAQTLGYALRQQKIGKPYLIYAELDDDFIPQAPYEKWISESGAPWPYRDEFLVGCTLEHAGYYLTWLMAIFGSVKKVVAASADLIDDKLEPGANTAPDFSTATLFFESGMVARLTCSIIAPHDHKMRVYGKEGILEINECWNNTASVKVRRRHVIRRKLINSPFAKKVSLPGPTHPKVGRKGAATMNFALGPAEMLDALSEGRESRVSADFALHLNEVTLAIQNAHDVLGVQEMKTTMPKVNPMPWANID